MISPTFAVRAGGVFQKCGHRRPKLHHRRSRRRLRGDDVEADRCGEGHRELCSHRHPRIAGLRRAVLPAEFRRIRMPNPFTPGKTIRSHQCRRSLSEFGGSDRNNFYGVVNRDFFSVHQDIATNNVEVQVTPDLTLSDKVRASRSLLNYIGTIPESPITEGPMSGHVHRQPAKPPSADRRRRQPERGNLQVRYLQLAPHRGRRRRGLARNFQHRYLSRADLGRKYAAPFNGSGSAVGASIFNPAYTFEAVCAATPHREADADRDRHDERLPDRFRQLPRSGHPQWRHPLRRLRHQDEWLRHVGPSAAR